jgi:hypothetical protein
MRSASKEETRGRKWYCKGIDGEGGLKTKMRKISRAEKSEEK